MWIYNKKEWLENGHLKNTAVMWLAHCKIFVKEKVILQYNDSKDNVISQCNYINGNLRIEI